MSFSIIRVQPVRNMAAAQKHDFREYAPDQLADNIQPGEQGTYGFNSYYLRGENKTIAQAVKERFAEAGIKPRKGAVQALEYVVTASPDFWAKTAQDYDASAVLARMTEFIMARHGTENVMSITCHFDESTPHAHVVVTPIVRKEVNYGGKPKVKNRLCARDFINGPEQLRQLQTDFHEHINAFTKRRLGYELHRGATAAKERVKEYTRRTDHKIGALRASMAALSADLDRALEYSEEIRKKQEEMKQLQQGIEKAQENLAIKERISKVNWNKFDHLQEHLNKKSRKKGKDQGFSRG